MEVLHPQRFFPPDFFAKKKKEFGFLGKNQFHRKNTGFSNISFDFHRFFNKTLIWEISRKSSRNQGNPLEILEVLEKREGLSGIKEKEGRK